MQQNTEARNKPTHGQLIYYKGASEGKTVSSINGVGKTE